jgi:hypothetical protein
MPRTEVYQLRLTKSEKDELARTDGPKGTRVLKQSRKTQIKQAIRKPKYGGPQGGRPGTSQPSTYGPLKLRRAKNGS